jgi:hypothetical protein
LAEYAFAIPPYRLRERKRLYDELRLDALNDEIMAECDCIFDTERALESLDPSPDKFARR